VRVPSGFSLKPLRLVVLLKYTNVPCAAAGVGVGVAPGGVGIGVGVGVGLGFALTPPHPARERINNRAKTGTLQAETKFFIDSPPGEGRLLLDENAQVSSRLAGLSEFGSPNLLQREKDRESTRMSLMIRVNSRPASGLFRHVFCRRHVVRAIINPHHHNVLCRWCCRVGCHSRRGLALLALRVHRFLRRGWSVA
jgi:hypothetical protein